MILIAIAVYRTLRRLPVPIRNSMRKASSMRDLSTEHIN